MMLGNFNIGQVMAMPPVLPQVIELTRTTIATVEKLTRLIDNDTDDPISVEGLDEANHDFKLKLAALKAKLEISGVTIEGQKS